MATAHTCRPPVTQVRHSYWTGHLPPTAICRSPIARLLDSCGTPVRQLHPTRRVGVAQARAACPTPVLERLPTCNPPVQQGFGLACRLAPFEKRDGVAATPERRRPENA